MVDIESRLVCMRHLVSKIKHDCLLFVNRALLTIVGIERSGILTDWKMKVFKLCHGNASLKYGVVVEIEPF